jgi:hypothetical protein
MRLLVAQALGIYKACAYHIRGIFVVRIVRYFKILHLLLIHRPVVKRPQMHIEEVAGFLKAVAAF